MICFHSLNYWYLQQQIKHYKLLVDSCDLLSFFELLIFTTTGCRYDTYPRLLWFAFILWTTDIYNNRKLLILGSECVVICFHSLNYWYLQQRNACNSIGRLVVICFHSLNYWYLQQQIFILNSSVSCCDLLSFFELLIFTTTRDVFIMRFWLLWFAFILWTTDIYNNAYLTFQTIPLLWFAFILWTTDIYNNLRKQEIKTMLVVICFHSLNYWYLQQLASLKCLRQKCCDLLSFFELLIFTTTNIKLFIVLYLLWFAFILWTTDIYNNSLRLLPYCGYVVICFHSLNYWYLQQQKS